MELQQSDQLQGINQRYIELCRQQGLNPSTLKEVLFYRSKGFNNTQIAERIGIHRVTVQNYAEKLREMDTEDFQKLLGGILLFAGAVALLSELFKTR